MSADLASWFGEAKIGIYLAWGPYSVPGFSAADGSQAAPAPGSPEWFRDNPDASWYINGLRQPDSATRAHHRATFGMHAGYGAFVRRFGEQLDDWDPASWIELFKEAGARYVVVPAMDLDGFLTWPGEGELHCERDLPAELAEPTRRAGLKFGISWSVGIDWTIQHKPVTSLAPFVVPGSGKLDADAFLERTRTALTERIATLNPDLVHNPSPLPSRFSAGKLLGQRDDLGQIVWSGEWKADRRKPDARTIRSAMSSGAPLTQSLRTPRPDSPGRGLAPQVPTVRYGMPEKAPKHAWQYLHVLGGSLGYTGAASRRSGGPSLISLLAEVASLGGNLLIAVSPRADGHIPREQREELAALSLWLRKNEEAIYATRPWRIASSTTPDGVPVRYTSRRDAVYAIVLGRPASLAIDLPGFDPRAVPQPPEVDVRDYRLVATILDADRAVEWRRTDKGVSVDIPGSFVPRDATVIRFRWQL